MLLKQKATPPFHLVIHNFWSYPRFGESIALCGNTLVVGNSYQNSPSESQPEEFSFGSPTGAIYVFERQADEWVETTFRKAPNLSVAYFFGRSVACSDSHVAVQEITLSNNGLGPGAVHVYAQEADGNWMLEGSLFGPQDDAGDLFGASLAFEGDRLAVGVPGEDSSSGGQGFSINNDLPSSGAVYIYSRNQGGGGWGHDTRIKRENPAESDRFGVSIALTADFLLVGVPGDDANRGTWDTDGPFNAANSGGVEVYTVDSASGALQHLALVKSGWPGSSDGFGEAVAAAAGLMVVGARYEDSPASGVDGDPAPNSLSQSGAAYIRALSPQ